jgi:hypothetical protein
VLLSEVEQIEGAAAREARTRGWDLNEIEDLMRRMLAETQCTLGAADSTLCKWKAAHHAACVGDLADEASEAGSTECWSRQDCTVFREELEWGLQAFHGANAKLELLAWPTHKRQTARLRAERVEAAARHAREVVDRVLWDHAHGWEEPQRFGLDHHQPIHLEESCGQGGRRGVQAGSVADEIWGLQEWAWRSSREAEVDSGGWPGGIEAGPSEAWTSRPADLERHWLGETKYASKELPRTALELGEEAGRPRLHGAAGEAPGELAFQHGEHQGSLGRGGDDNSRKRYHSDLHGNEDHHVEAVKAEQPQPCGVSSEAPGELALQGDESEGWPGGCKRAQHQVDLLQRAGTAVSKKRKLPLGSGGACEAKRRPAQRPSRMARTCRFICRRKATPEAAQDGQSGFQEDAAPSTAKEGESEGATDESKPQTEDCDRAGLRGPADPGSRRSLGWDPGGLTMGA